MVQYLRMSLFAHVLERCGVEAMIVLAPSNVFYLSGYPGEDCSVVLTQDNAYLITDPRYVYEAERSLNGRMQVVLAENNLYAQLAELAFRDGARRVGIEDTIPHRAWQALHEACVQKSQDIVTVSDALIALREIKSEYEIACIEQSQRITDKVFEEILPYIRPGVSENEIAARIEFAMRLQGASPAFATIVASGLNGCSPHAHPSDKPIANGEWITMDFGAKLHGYCSDMTRTVACGQVPPKQIEMYHAVLEAQQNALQHIRAGMTGKQADAYARDVLAKYDMAQDFKHSLGHGLGVDIHEGIALSPRCDRILQPGMVVSVEPGVYRDGVCGIRIEDIVVIQEHGVRDLTRSNKNLMIL